MITVGSVPRSEAESWFPFLAEGFRGRRGAIKEFTHRDPDFVFWIFPNGRLHNARDAHAKNVPRGRIASQLGRQLVVIYCRSEALAEPGDALTQFLRGLSQLPVLVREDALVISDNADIYGTVTDLRTRGEASS